MEQRKSIIRFFVNILVLFAIVAGVFSYIISNRLRESACEHYQLLANDNAESINAWLAAKKEVLVNQRASLESIDNFDAAYLTRFLERAVIGRKDSDEICDLYFIDTDGALTTANGFYTDFDLRTRNYYLGCLDNREIYYTSPYRDISTGSFVMTLSVSCNRQDGNLAGVLALDIYIDAFLEVVRESSVPENSYLFLIDSYFGMASHPNEAFGYVDDLPQEASALQDGLYSGVVEQIQSGAYRMITMRDYDGVSRNMFVSDISSCDWSVVAAISDDVLKQPERLIIGYIVIALLINLVMGILWTLSGTRRIMNRLSEERLAADSANSAKSSFLADMSHEIRTPINAVLGMNEMILRESKEQDILAYAKNIDRAGRNTLSIINDILDFSKIESGKMEILEAPYLLSAVLNDISNMLRFRSQEKNLAFDVSVEETIPDHLKGDEVRVRQVITNILTNAVKYTEEGSVKLVVKGEDIIGEKVTLSFSVIDTGIGIKPEDMDKLFSKFERVDLEKNKAVEGTGLGLAITKRLVEMMHGEIRAESEYGKGSVFTITLPQTVLDDEPIGNFREALRKSMEQRAAYRESFRAPDAKLLVVDDTPLNLMVITGLLKKTQVQLDTAPGGKEALELTLKNRYDLIFMDQRMPGMDGATVLKEIRAQEAGLNTETTVICLTADAVQGARDRYLAEGFSDYLSKPVESSSLEDMLVKYLPQEKVVRLVKTEDDKPVAETGTNTSSVQERKEAENHNGGVQGDGTLRTLYEGNDMLHFEAAMQYSVSESMLEKTLKVFYDTLPANMEQIERFYEQGDYENYTIKVHAMKSGARMVGATEISELARRLEECGDEILQEKAGE